MPSLCFLRQATLNNLSVSWCDVIPQVAVLTAVSEASYNLPRLCGGSWKVIMENKFDGSYMSIVPVGSAIPCLFFCANTSVLTVEVFYNIFYRLRDRPMACGERFGTVNFAFLRLCA